MKPHNITLILLLCLFLFSCKEHVVNNIKKQEIKLLGSFHLINPIDSLLKEYSKQFPNALAYAIFTDKKDPEEYCITIVPFDKKIDSLNNIQALNYFLLNDSTPVFLFSGIEDFITSRNKRKLYNPDFQHSWSFIKTRDTSYVVEGNNYPFMNLRLKPTIYFHPSLK
jgi:hypothetical protein